MTVPEEILAARPGVVAARHEARAALAALDDELDRLEASALAAVDIPAKMRRNPVRTAGVAAGAGFILVGGPIKVLRRARNAVFGKPDPLPRSMLPKEIDKAVSELGTDGARVRGTIEREFASYLREKAPERKERDFAGTVTSLLSQVGTPLARRFGRQLAEQVLAPDGPGFQEQLAKVKARRAQAGDPGDTGRDK
jgi:hypothetical protein